ncbi:hypothetical protein BBD42_22370 [Paenibacillus sp. BIHB 4019]|uniref:Uncharacterized protein n=1 Tax=Paenibacillus sp. BIHB 4019 TaxID=1870819 RepID=A0A1B2DMI8_9BACL|nr:hypothetical protein BBD42_22370 [Paenibacillus sp. BIHB 4019]
MNKNKLFLWSCIFPLSSIFWSQLYQDGYRIFKLGFPFNFITYHGLEAPAYNILIFKNFFTLTSFRLDIYILCVLATYFCLILLIKMINRIKSPTT